MVRSIAVIAVAPFPHTLSTSTGRCAICRYHTKASTNEARNQDLCLTCEHENALYENDFQTGRQQGGGRTARLSPDSGRGIGEIGYMLQQSGKQFRRVFHQPPVPLLRKTSFHLRWKMFIPPHVIWHISLF